MERGMRVSGAMYCIRLRAVMGATNARLSLLIIECVLLGTALLRRLTVRATLIHTLCGRAIRSDFRMKENSREALCLCAVWGCTVALADLDIHGWLVVFVRPADRKSVV